MVWGLFQDSATMLRVYHSRDGFRQGYPVLRHKSGLNPTADGNEKAAGASREAPAAEEHYGPRRFTSWPLAAAR